MRGTRISATEWGWAVQIGVDVIRPHGPLRPPLPATVIRSPSDSRSVIWLDASIRKRGGDDPTTGTRREDRRSRHVGARREVRQPLAEIAAVCPDESNGAPQARGRLSIWMGDDGQRVGSGWAAGGINKLALPAPAKLVVGKRVRQNDVTPARARKRSLRACFLAAWCTPQQFADGRFPVCDGGGRPLTRHGPGDA